MSRFVSYIPSMISFGVEPKVIVATSINPKFVGGRLLLNASLKQVLPCITGYRVLCTEKAELIETGSGCATYPALMGSLPAWVHLQQKQQVMSSILAGSLHSNNSFQELVAHSRRLAQSKADQHLVYFKRILDLDPRNRADLKLFLTSFNGYDYTKSMDLSYGIHIRNLLRIRSKNKIFRMSGSI
ncbi:hypothetical protein YC2023_025180 [Brassica napus]